MDRISGLPDEILCLIISHLPTKYAACTSILSTRWKGLWRSIPNVDFDDTLLFNGTARGSLPNIDFHHKLLSTETALTGHPTFSFIDVVLSILNNFDSDIEKFRLHCSYEHNIYCVERCISLALIKGVKEVDLFLDGMWSLFELPGCLLTSSTLEVLKLCRNCEFHIPSHVHLPNLKVLHLHMAAFQDFYSSVQFLSGCPVLEELVIWIEDPLEFNDIHVSTPPTLKRLEFHCIMCDPKHTHGCTITVDAANNYIKHLVITENENSRYVFTHLSGISTAKVDALDGIVAILQEISAVKYLSLSYVSLEAMSNDHQKLPVFNNLTHLDLANEMYDHQLQRCHHGALVYPHVINRLLETLPNLKSLAINAEWIRLTKWHRPEAVPSCVASNLEMLHCKGFKGQEDDTAFVKFFVENAKVLNKVIIN